MEENVSGLSNPLTNETGIGVVVLLDITVAESRNFV